MSATALDTRRLPDLGAPPVPSGQGGRPGTVSVVVPVYNEEAILVETVERLREGLARLSLDWWEIILCENGSSDDTLPIARQLERALPEVRLISLPWPDYGAAMRAGFIAARGEVIVNFDADYYDVDFLSAALSLDADIVVAAKGLADSHDARVLLRRVVSRCFGWLVRRLLGLRVTETHGMKLFHQRAIESLVPMVRSTKDLFDTELVARAEWARLAIAELPVRTEEQRHSRSGILRRIPRTLWGLVRLRRLRRTFTSVAPAPVLPLIEDRAVGAAA